MKKCNNDGAEDLFPNKSETIRKKYILLYRYVANLTTTQKRDIMRFMREHKDDICKDTMVPDHNITFGEFCTFFLITKLHANNN